MQKLNLIIKTLFEREAAFKLCRHAHRYERVGYDTRTIVLLLDGTVGAGAADREIWWDIRDNDGGLHLEIGSETELTCRLVPTEHQAWSGNWLLGECMPIRLTMIYDVKIADALLYHDHAGRFVRTSESLSKLFDNHRYHSYLLPRLKAEQAGLCTILDPSRLRQLTTLLLHSLAFEGDTIECGVYKGGVSAIIAQLTAGTNKVHFLCDSFVGLPEHSEHDNHHRAGDFSGASVPEIKEGLAALGLAQHTKIMPGWFSDNLPLLCDRTFCFAHIDSDYYSSTRECLEFIYPRMSDGGWIVLDDYTLPTCKGVRTAVDEFFADKSEVVVEISGSVAAVQRRIAD